MVHPLFANGTIGHVAYCRIRSDRTRTIMNFKRTLDDHATITETTTEAAAEANAPREPEVPARPRSRYIPALDGIRTVAVAAVVLYHLGFSWIQGGLQGVTVFFVLSGYLITHLLIVEFDGTGRIDLKDFWIRRIRRLLPAIVTVIVATAALCALFNHVMLTKMRPDIVPSLLFFNNWWQILRNVSYFDALGDPSPLTHFWSLAIEEQFYLIWPLLLLALMKVGAKRPTIRRITLAIALVSAAAMAVLYDPAVDPSRVYYGTDTRVFSLLLGAWLAFIPEGTLRLEGLFGRAKSAAPSSAEQATPSPQPAEAATDTDGDVLREPEFIRQLVAESAANAAGTRAPIDAHAAPAKPRFRILPIDIVGLVGLCGLVAIMLCTNGYTSFQYHGGTLLCTVLTLALIAACVQPDSLLARLFALPPLVWLGKRSYGIYLWHYPLLLLMNPVSDISAKPWWMYVIQILVIVGVAELSYRFIETPFRRGAWGKIMHALKHDRVALGTAARRNAAVLAACAAIAGVAVGGIALVPDTSALSEEGAALLEQGADSAGDKPAAGSPVATNDAKAGAETPTNEQGFPQDSFDIVMIGDSVSVRTVPFFEQRFPYGHIDALKNRQFTAGIKVYQQLLDANQAGGILVFALGTNGLMTDEQIDTLMGLAGDKRTVVFVNTRSPQPWVGATNEAIARAAERYSNVRVVDWYGFSEGRNDLFDGDGTHLNDAGAQAYIDLVYNAVQDILPIHLDNPEQQQALQDKLNAATSTLADPLTQGIIAAFGGEMRAPEEE